MDSNQIQLELLVKLSCKNNINSIKISADSNLTTFKDELIKAAGLRVSKDSLGLFLQKKGAASYETVPLISLRKSLDEFNVKDGDKVILKNLGPQVSWRLVFVLEYLGPILIFLYFFLRLGWDNANLTQRMAFCMGVCHFVKRELESIFVHVFSRPTMPLRNLAINCIYYWLLFGASVGYTLFSDKYEEPTFFPPLRYFFFFIFVSAELKNLKCHIILRDLRSSDPEKRGIPFGEGFEYVSAANYFWEIMAWLSFSIFVNLWSAYLFTLCGFLILRNWSLKKHKDYLKTFGDKYPKNRKAFIPFFI